MCDDECVKVDTSYTNVPGAYARLNGGYTGMRKIMDIPMLMAMPVQINYAPMKSTFYEK